MSVQSGRTSLVRQGPDPLRARWALVRVVLAAVSFLAVMSAYTIVALSEHEAPPILHGISAAAVLLLCLWDAVFCRRRARFVRAGASRVALDPLDTVMLPVILAGWTAIGVIGGVDGSARSALLAVLVLALVIAFGARRLWQLPADTPVAIDPLTAPPPPDGAARRGPRERGRRR